MGSKSSCCKNMVYVSIILLCTIFICCSDKNTNYQGKLYVRLYDASANYDKMEITIVHLRLHRSGSSGSSGWYDIDSRITESINLLDLRYGKYDTLFFDDVSSGKYDQLELRFGFCSVTVNGALYPLQLSQNTFVLDCEFEVKDLNLCKLSLDFDALRSVVNNGSYSLVPKIRIENADFCGSIAGLIHDNSDNPIPATILSMIGTDTVSTTNDISQFGLFQLFDLPEGTYSIRIVPDTLSWHDTTITDLLVSRGQSHDIGIIHLNHR